MEKNGIIELKYINEKRLGVHDFIESIKKDLLKKISKNRVFIDEERIIYFEIWHTDNNDKWFLSFFNSIKNLMKVLYVMISLLYIY